MGRPHNCPGFSCEGNAISFDFRAHVSLGTILHELCHVAGLSHEQQRPDRDDYLAVDTRLLEDFPPLEQAQWSVRAPSDCGKDLGPYDTTSIMHYGVCPCPRRQLAVARVKPALLNFTKPAIRPHHINMSLGQRVGLSLLDVKKLYTLYASSLSGSEFPEAWLKKCQCSLLGPEAAVIFLSGPRDAAVCHSQSCVVPGNDAVILCRRCAVMCHCGHVIVDAALHAHRWPKKSPVTCHCNCHPVPDGLTIALYVSTLRDFSAGTVLLYLDSCRCSSLLFREPYCTSIPGWPCLEFSVCVGPQRLCILGQLWCLK